MNCHSAVVVRRPFACVASHLFKTSLGFPKLMPSSEIEPNRPDFMPGPRLCALHQPQHIETLHGHRRIPARHASGGAAAGPRHSRGPGTRRGRARPQFASVFPLPNAGYLCYKAQVQFNLKPEIASWCATPLMNRPDQPHLRHRVIPGHQPARPTPAPAQGTREGTGKLRVHRGHPPSRQPATPPAGHRCQGRPTRQTSCDRCSQWRGKRRTHARPNNSPALPRLPKVEYPRHAQK